jgi:hypothetical protein
LSPYKQPIMPIPRERRMRRVKRRGTRGVTQGCQR